MTVAIPLTPVGVGSYGFEHRKGQTKIESLFGQKRGFRTNMAPSQ